MKKILFFMTFLLLPLSMLSHAAWTTTEGPPNWGPWYLYQSNISTYTIECVYKRKEIKENNSSSGMNSIRTETQRLQISRYPFGRCPDTMN
ncbi:hypothetical protein HYG93_05760 [Acinetobacter sp. SwsAc6]|uniref:hypothetical protein n=1 Tax=Acinetobacter TaxID=469 RepID=UPI0011C3FBF0|nr:MULTISPECIES: hypothetical protein [Acinetobacter]NWK73804.1 hypothetical protein [Acinetobacter sp. SwsAc6]